MKIFVGTPMLDGSCKEAYTMSVINLCGEAMRRKIGLEFYFLSGESILPRARNNIAHNFLYNSDADYLLFIDSDMGFNAAEILDMLNTDKEVISAVCQKKKIDWNGVKNAAQKNVPTSDLPFYGNIYVFQGEHEPVRLGSREPVEVDVVGTGILFIHRSVFEHLIPHVKTYRNVEEGTNVRDIHEFFSIGIHPETRVMLSEDFYFSKLWKDNGGKLFVAPWTNVMHIGNHAFGGF